MILFLYIAKELLFPFFLSTGVISSILLMEQVFQFMPFLQAGGVDGRSIAQIVLLSLPPALMIAMPISVMIGVYAGINRMSNDSEMVVIRSAGVSIWFISLPVTCVTFFIALFVSLQMGYLAPLSVTGLERLKFNILKKQTKINLSVGQINRFFGEKLIYIFQKEGDLLKGVFISDWDSPLAAPIVEASLGRIYLDERLKKIIVHLEDGRVHQFLGDGAYQITDFAELDYNLRSFTPDRSHLPERFRRDQYSGAGKMNVEYTSRELWRIIEESKEGSKNYWEARDEFHGRIASVLSCFGFAIFALSMAIYNPRRSKAGNIVLMVAMMIGFFMIFYKARTMLAKGLISPSLVYVPIVLLLAIGLFRCHRINQDMGVN